LRHPRVAPLLIVALIAMTACPVPAIAAGGGTGIHYIYLIRHGDYDRNRDLGDPDSSGLNALGHEQAKLLAARLAELPVRLATLVTSPYPRAYQTARDLEPVLHMTPVVDTLLHECGPTSDRADYMKRHAAEEIAACDSNLARAWARYVVPTPDADRHDVLVCHGNVIRWFVSRAMSGDPAHWLSMDIGNASITIIAVRPDGSPRLVMFSDVGHLPVEKQTWTGKGAGWGSAERGMR